MSRFVERRCPLCGSAAARAEVRAPQPAEALTPDALAPYWSGLFMAKSFFTYHRCEDCGLLYNPRFFDRDQLAALYASMAPNMNLVGDDAIAATQRGYFARAAAGRTFAGDYLEIGPDVGHVVGAAARHGEFDRFWLFEPNRAVHAVLRAAAGGAPAMIRSDMEDLSAVPDASADLAVMVHVLDHLLDPVAMLRQVRTKLRAGGTLMIVTHNERSALRYAMGVRWPPFCLQHPELYNPATMRNLLVAIGFDAVTVERSRNHFPIPFLVRQAAWAAGLRIDRVPLPDWSIGLRLGNMLTLARAPGQAAARTSGRLAR